MDAFDFVFKRGGVAAQARALLPGQRASRLSPPCSPLTIPPPPQDDYPYQGVNNFCRRDVQRVKFRRGGGARAHVGCRPRKRAAHEAAHEAARPGPLPA